MARGLSADRPARLLLVLRGVHPHHRFDVQPARQVAEGVQPHPLAAADRLAQLPALEPRLAAGPQRLQPPGPGLHRPRGQQEGRGCARLPAAGRELPALGHRPLPAQPQLRQRRRRRQAAGPAVADDGRGGPALRGGPGHLGVGQQRQGRRARRRHGLLRRRADARDAGRRRPPAAARAGAEGPRHQRRQPDEAAAGERAPARPVGPGLRRAVHHRQASHLRLPRLPVADSPAHLPPTRSPQPPRARLQGRGDDQHAVRHVRDERPRPLPPGGGRDRPGAEAGGEGRLRQAGDPRQADGAQGVHRPPRRGHAGDRGLDLGAAGGIGRRPLDRGRQRLSRERLMEGDKAAAGAMAPSGKPDLDGLLKQYGCGPVRLAGTEAALYERHLLLDNVVDPAAADPRERYEALARSVRDILSQRWVRTEQTYESANPKRVYYLSMEFLIGRALTNNITNLLLGPVVGEAVKPTSLDWLGLLEEEPDAGLGNGGLGRLAACFLDSMATMQLPAMGYGLRYEYGMFRQSIKDGWQHEQPDNWLRRPDPWEVARPEQQVEVKLGCSFRADGANLRAVLGQPFSLLGIPFDRPVVGYGGATHEQPPRGAGPR